MYAAVILYDLGMAGGQAPETYALRTFRIMREDREYLIQDERMRKRFYKHEDDKVDVVFDWSDFLGDSTISSVTWEAKGKTGKDSTTLTVSNTSNTSTRATAYLSAGGDQMEYNLRCTVVTGDAIPRTFTRTAEVLVRDVYS